MHVHVRDGNIYMKLVIYEFEIFDRILTACSSGLMLAAGNAHCPVKVGVLLRCHACVSIRLQGALHWGTTADIKHSAASGVPVKRGTGRMCSRLRVTGNRDAQTDAGLWACADTVSTRPAWASC
jgi:hypothetical protein